MKYFWTIAVPLLVSGALSIFGSDLRLLFQKGGHKLRVVALHRDQDRLRLLDRLNGSAYEVILWLCLDLRLTVFETLFFAFVALQMWMRHSPIVWFPFSFAVGAWIGTLLRIYGVLAQLQHYDRARLELQQRMIARAGKVGLENLK